MEERAERISRRQKNEVVMHKNIPLQFPIPVKQEDGSIKKVGEICLRRVKAKDMQHIPEELMENEGKLKNPADMYPLLASISELPIEAIEELDMDDFIKIVGELEGFLSASLGTGSK